MIKAYQKDGRLVEFLDGKYQGKQGYICYKCVSPTRRLQDRR